LAIAWINDQTIERLRNKAKHDWDKTVDNI
jgi:hypothetical protein